MISSSATYDDAQLILKLYELRREEKLRAAREWFANEFFPQSLEEVKAVVGPGRPHNTEFRMVVSYWDMAASFAARGPLNAELLLESSGEMCLVWSRIGHLIEDIRAEFKLQEYLRNIEEVINTVEWGPSRVEWLRQRFADAAAARQKGEAGAGR